jgi:hypothetical protein
MSGVDHALIEALAEPTPEATARVRAWIEAIAEHVRVGSKKPLPRPNARALLTLADARRAAEVAELLIDAGGNGVHETLQRLLAHIALCSSVELVPFWTRVLLPRRMAGRRDTTASMRSQFAARVLLADRLAGDVETRDALLAALPKLSATDRGELMLHAAHRGRFADELPPGEHGSWLEVVTRAAAEDPSFEVRYLARCALRLAGCPRPETAAGTHAFELKYEGFSCVIELRARASLRDLHAAIQRALGWDADHVWCFHLNGDRRDDRFTWPTEDWLRTWAPEIRQLLRGVMREVPVEPDASENDALDPQPEVLGELGLRAGDAILYHFDFGDDHLIPLKLLRIAEAPTRGQKLPAITREKGRRPAQYWSR